MSKYLNPKNYLRKAFVILNQKLLSPIEAKLASNHEESLSHRPIFFLGAPRSGSTLMVQVITDTLDVGYISNCHCRWFGALALAEHLFHPTRGRPASDFQSKQGDTKGNYAPAECGEWWYRFFRRKPPYMSLDEVSPKRMQQLRQSVAALTDAFDRPILFKNLYASLRIQAIAHYFPESLFIVTHRNEIDNGHSLLEARYEAFNDYNPWLSIEPPEVEILKLLPPHQQVIEQIRHTHKTIDQDLSLSRVSEGRRFDLVYEDFCKDPENAIKQIHQFLTANGAVVNRIRQAPSAFKQRKEIRIDSSIYESMVKYAVNNNQ